MWTCPKCGREFKRTNQGHYCGKAPETVEEYMESQNSEAQAHIAGLRDIIRRCVPDVTELNLRQLYLPEKRLCKSPINLLKNYLSALTASATKFQTLLLRISLCKASIAPFFSIIARSSAGFLR